MNDATTTIPSFLRGSLPKKRHGEAQRMAASAGGREELPRTARGTAGNSEKNNAPKIERATDRKVGNE